MNARTETEQAEINLLLHSAYCGLMARNSERGNRYRVRMYVHEFAGAPEVEFVLIASKDKLCLRKILNGPSEWWGRDLDSGLRDLFMYADARRL